MTPRVITAGVVVFIGNTRVKIKFEGVVEIVCAGA